VTDPLVVRGPEGAITVASAALERLVVAAAESVEGARVRRPKRSVEVAHGAGRASVSFALAVEQGVPVPQLALAVQKQVAAAAAAISGLEIDKVDVFVEEIV
jgi:uncharacterized alkaline shock family protein YloU